jgi:hypothetical protein
MSALSLCTLTPCVKLSPLYLPNCEPSTVGRKLSCPLSPLFDTLTSCVQAAENTATLSPFPATLTSYVKRKSFVCHSYKKQRGVGYVSFAFVARHSPLITRHLLP